jgi:hypothetical protein
METGAQLGKKYRTQRGDAVKLIVEIDVPNWHKERFEETKEAWFSTESPDLVSVDSAYLKHDPEDEDYYVFKFVEAKDEG